MVTVLAELRELNPKLTVEKLRISTIRIGTEIDASGIWGRE